MKITIQMPSGPVSIEAAETSSPFFAVHAVVDGNGKPDRRRGYAITHIPTGMGVVSALKHRKDAFTYAELLASVETVPWESTDANRFRPYQIPFAIRTWIGNYERIVSRCDTMANLAPENLGV